MKISRLKIKNFRTLEDIDLSFDGYFSSISGKNNAGKTSVIKSIKSIFRGGDREFSFFEEDEKISYATSKTQWAPVNSEIYFGYWIDADESSDPGLHGFIKKIAGMESLSSKFVIQVSISIKSKDERDIDISVNNNTLEKFAAQEVYRRLSSTNIIFLHNSTGGYNRIFLHAGAKSFHEMILSRNEKDELKKEQEKIKNKVKKFAQEHRTELAGLLGKLEEKYEVELNVFEGLFRDTIPLGINLRDKGVEVPLDDWGAGTQNRTHIMMSILSANRIKQQINDENRITPIIIIEEPESFLHPSAQAEFGRVIRGLARELEIQIVITTHSPYMLCQESPESNILLNRRAYRGRLKETHRVEVTAKKWMEPFSEILGLNDESIEPWRDVVRAAKDRAILVEGIIDKEYLEFISSKKLKGFEIPEGVEVIAYGGKDALKNSIMLKFIIEKFDRVYITFDLDANGDLQKTMHQLGLTEGEDYMALGINEDGKECIEGLLPKELLSKVHSENTDLVMKLTSNDNSKRKSAKNYLKEKLLISFKESTEISSADIKGFKEFFSNINTAFK